MYAYVALAVSINGWGLDALGNRRDKSDIRKRTPPEQAIAEQTSRVARYEARMRAKGFKRTTIFVREDRLDEVKAFIKAVNEDAPGGSVHD